ncbi:circadian clock protein KaiC [Magnetovibrio sp. PR-2]|uniref:circadian clock protein KaiC n=1 Tax=Magnetovibrio sp. PR-2 TaxID=3120356 RepID=UPI002FCE59A2
MAKAAKKSKKASTPIELAKSPTGIQGLDQITNGGFPTGRSTLVCGGAGSGKTLLGMEFLVKGAMEFDEPGVFVAFEETEDELSKNVSSLGYDLPKLVKQKKLLVDHIYIDHTDVGAGDYTLDGLFIRLGAAIDEIGAKRVVLDTVETLFAALPNHVILRAELRRLFAWMKDKGVTAVITAERGDGLMTRHGLEEYVSDCVISLEQRVENQVSTRRMRIVKYRGSAHGSDEYPFLLDQQGFTVVPTSAIGLQYEASDEFISTGIPRLDEMYGGKGYFRGSTMLVTGTAGTGKTSLSAHFVNAACRRGEKCLYITFEESADQLMRNMSSIGLNLRPWAKKNLLRFEAVRPSAFGIEMHLAHIQKLVDAYEPQVVVLDPISSFDVIGDALAVQSMLMRLVDLFKGRQISTMFTSLTSGGDPVEQTDAGISSLIDSWLLLRNLEQGGERTRALYILKARGIAHSNRVREFILTNDGVDLVDVYVGPDGILTGAARAVQEMLDQDAIEARDREHGRVQAVLERKRKAMEAKIAELETEFEAERRDLEQTLTVGSDALKSMLNNRSVVAQPALEKGPKRARAKSKATGRRK